MENNELEKANKSRGIVDGFIRYLDEGDVIVCDMVQLIEYICNDILGGKTRSVWSRDNGKTYPAHRYAKGRRFVIGGVEFISKV